MTQPATTRRAGPFFGNGLTTSFPFTFKVFSTSDIALTLTAADGTDTALTLNTDYSVTLNADQDSNPGGSITYPLSGSPLATGQKLTGVGSLPYDQTFDFPPGGNYRAKNHEDAFDRTVAQIQQLAERASRTLTLAPSAAGVGTELPSPQANFLLGWDPLASRVTNIDPSVVGDGSGPAVDFITDVFSGDATTVNFALRAEPGVSSNSVVAISGVVQTPGIDYTITGTTLTFTAPPPAGTQNVMITYGRSLPQGPVTPTPTPSSGGGIWVNVTDFMTDEQLAGVNGTGPLVDVIDAIEAAIAVCGDITWKGSMLAQRPSAGGMKAGGTVGFPPGVYTVSRTIYVPPHVRLTGQAGGGFFMPRPNDSTTANGNAANVRGAQILANFPAGSGANQAGQMWVISTANWNAGGASRPAFNKCYAGAADIDAGNVSMVPGIGIDNIWIDSVRIPATGLHVANQIPYGGVRLIAALNARVQNIHIEGVDHALFINSSWGYHVQNVFGYAYLGGLLQVNDANAGKITQVYVNRDRTLDATAPRTLSNTNRLDGITAGALDNDSAGFPEDFTNMRMGCFVQFPNGLHLDTVTAEGWDIALCVNQAPNSALTISTFYSEATSITPWACVGQLGTVSGFFDFSPGSRYGYCWGLVNSFLASGLLPRRLHVMPASIDPNRNIQIAVGKPDLYRNLGGGKSANMITWSNDVSQGATLANMTATAYSQTAPDGSFTAGTLTASGAGVASFAKSGANIAPITGTTIDFVNFGQNQPYCHWADFKAGTAPVTAIELAFSGGSARSVKAVITWSGGVPSLALSGHSSVTGFAEALGNDWYRINVAGNCGNNTTMVATVYIGDGSGTPTAGHTLFMGEHEVNPTQFPLFPIYNMSATVPVSRNPGVSGQGETWEYRPGINYLGDTQNRIRVSANGNPYALGLDTGNPNTGTYTTWDAALARIAASPLANWQIVVRDGNTLVQTANNQGVVQRNKNISVDKEGAGSNFTLNAVVTPSGTAPYIPMEGRCTLALENCTINMPSSAASDATLAGFVFLQAGNAFNEVTFSLRNASMALNTTWAVVQQGFDSVNALTAMFRNVSISGTASARMHSQSAGPSNSKTRIGQISTGLTFTGVVNSSIGTNGYENCQSLTTAT